MIEHLTKKNIIKVKEEKFWSFGKRSFLSMQSGKIGLFS